MWNVFRVLEMEVFTGTEGVTAESCPNLEGCAGAGGERPACRWSFERTLRGGWERVFMHREPERGQLRQVPTWAKEVGWDQASGEPEKGMTRAAGRFEGERVSRAQ